MSGQFDVVLRRAGAKATHARSAVLEALHNTPRTFADLKKTVGKRAHQATLYRVLSELIVRGIIRRVDFSHQETQYEFSDHHHHHVVCEGCGTVEDIELCIPQSTTQKALAGAKGFASIREHSLEFFGTCQRCAQ